MCGLKKKVSSTEYTHTMQSVWWRIENNVHTTFVTEVINHDDLSQVFPWGSFDDAVHSPHQGGPALIMEDNDYAGGEEVFIIEPVFTPTDKENIQYYNTILEVTIVVELILWCALAHTV